MRGFIKKRADIFVALHGNLFLARADRFQAGLSTLFVISLCRVYLCMHTVCMQVAMVTYKRERDRQCSCFFPTTLEIPCNEKLEHRRPLCNERERDPLHILLVARRCYAHYIMRAVSLSVRLCE